MIKGRVVKKCFKCKGKGHTMTRRLVKQLNLEVISRVNDIIKAKNREVSFAERMRIKKRVETEVYKLYMKRYACKLCKGDGILVYPA